MCSSKMQNKSGKVCSYWSLAARKTNLKKLTVRMLGPQNWLFWGTGSLPIHRSWRVSTESTSQQSAKEMQMLQDVQLRHVTASYSFPPVMGCRTLLRSPTARNKETGACRVPEHDHSPYYSSLRSPQFALTLQFALLLQFGTHLMWSCNLLQPLCSSIAQFLELQSLRGMYGDLSRKERRLLLRTELPVKRSLEEQQALQRQEEDQLDRERFYRRQREREKLREMERARMAANDRGAWVLSRWGWL